MLKDLLAKYASLCERFEHVDAERVAVRDEIVKLMMAEGKKKEQTPLGTFTVARSVKWKYSPALEKAMEQLKIKQLREQDKGVAKSFDTPYILFTKPKR